MSKVNCIEFGDCRDLMRQWKVEGVKVQTCITSPPYFGLRDYGHEGQLGLEKTPDEYVAAMVEVFRCVRDILADDGTLWLNLGDSYASYRDGKATPDTTRGENLGTLVPKGQATNRMSATFKNTSIKHKDLIGIPWRVAFALQQDGWYLRQDIIWNKPNPMPESVKDRCTKAHEYIFLFSKSERYYFDSYAIKEPTVDNDKETRNRRSVWTVPTKPFKGAHFATFPSDLIEPCILAGAPIGGIVLDPFMGSGTTAEVAYKNNRKYLGCELNETYKILQEERLSIVQPNLI